LAKEVDHPLAPFLFALFSLPYLLHFSENLTAYADAQLRLTKHGKQRSGGHFRIRSLRDVQLEMGSDARSAVSVVVLK
jgi:hypothetical protein